MDSETVSKLFTPESLATLQGAALACWVVPNFLGKIFHQLNDVGRAALALLVALALQGAAISSVADKDVWTWLIGLLNAFLIASAASGLNEATTPRTVVFNGGGNDNGGGGGGGPADPRARLRARRAAPEDSAGTAPTTTSPVVPDHQVVLDAGRSTDRFSTSWFPRRLK